MKELKDLFDKLKEWIKTPIQSPQLVPIPVKIRPNNKK